MPLIQKKICLLGDFAVGKTSLVRRFVEGLFEDKYLSTIGTKVSRKTIAVDGKQLAMLIWDLAGSEKFSRVIGSYYRGAAGAVLVCDLTRTETLYALERYAADFHSVNPHAPLIVVGNKADLVTERTITEDDLHTFGNTLQAPAFTSSAKTGDNVERLFQTLGQALLSQ